jgi:hypothetical protein
MRYATALSVAVLSAVSLTATPIQAQVWSSTEVVDVARASQLETQASVAMNTPSRWTHAADLLREAASYRAGGDPTALSNLQMAGMMYASQGRLQSARSTLLELADRANTFGEVTAAAHALIDAAYVEVELRNVSAARRWSERAERLATSSHLTSDARRGIIDRLEQPVAVASIPR